MRIPRALAGLVEDREFLKLWIGGNISTLGFHVTVLAMQLTAVVVLEASPPQMGILGAAQFLPRFVFGLAAGAWVDRLHRRPVLIAADLGRAGLLASIPIAHLLGALTIEQLYVVALGMGTLSTFFEVAVLSYLPSLVSRDRLLDANSRMHAGEAVAQIAGPNLAGVLVQWLTAPIAIAFDAASYAISALFIAWIRRPEPPPNPADTRRPILREVGEGVRTVLAHPLLRGPMLTGITYGFFAGGIRGALIVLYLVQLGVSPIEFGVIYGVGGAAALLGAIAARPLAAALGLGRVLTGVHLFAAVFAAFVPLAGWLPQASLPILLVGQIGLSFVSPVWGVNAISLQQSVTPDALLGRVTATVRFAVNAVPPLGALAGGWLAVAVGLQATLAVAALGLSLGAIWLGVSSVRDLRQLPDPIG